MKFYKRDPDRALSGMAVLTLAQRGAYNTVLDLLYSRDGDLDDDDAKMTRMVNCHGNQWKAVKRQLMASGKIWSEGGKLHAKGVEKTMKDARNWSETQRKRVGNRWDNQKTNNENNDPPVRPGITSRASTAIAIATETEEEIRDSSDRPVGRRSEKPAAEKLAAKRAERGTRWPADAVISQDWIDEAADKRQAMELAPCDMPVQAEMFTNYWSGKSGRDATKLDWKRTWMNWVLKAEEKKSNGRARPPSSNDKFLAGANALLRKFDAESRTREGKNPDDDADAAGGPLLPR